MDRTKIYDVKSIGIFIILSGIGITVFTTLTSFAREKVVGIEKTEIIKNIPQKIHWYPLVGIGVLGIGALVLRRSS